MGLNVGTLQATLALDSKPFEAGAAEAVEKGGASLGVFGRLAETAGVEGAGMFSNGISGLKGDLAEIGLDGGALLAGGIAVAAVALGFKALEMGEEFHQAFAQLETDTGATGDHLEALKQQVTGIYADVPNGIMEVADAVGVLEGRLGGSAALIGPLAEQLLKFTNGFGGDAKTNAQQLADVMQRFNVPVKEGSKTLDEFAAASEASGVSAQQLMQAVANGAPDFQLLGKNLKDSIALSAAFAKVGADPQVLFQGIQHSVTALASVNQQNASIAQSNAKQAITDAENERTRIDAIATAWKGVQKANEQVATSEKALNVLLSGGIERAVTDGRNQLADATDSVTDAQAALIKSKEDLDDLLKGPSEDDEAKARLKLKQATDAVTASYTAQAKAQNDLSDAQTHGVTGTDLAALQDALTSATDNVTQSQLDQTDAQQALSDLQADSPKNLAAIAAAQQQVTESSHKLSDAQAAQQDTNASVIAQLGPQMDGSVMLAAANTQLSDAHDQVAQALQGVQSASQKQVSQQQAAVVATDAAGGTYSATNKILTQLGLTHASTADQVKGLGLWLLTTKDSTDRLAVAQELLGGRSAVQATKGIGDMAKGLQVITDAINDSTNAVNKGSDAHKSLGDQVSITWHSIQSAISPVTDWITEKMSGLLDDLTGIWSNMRLAFAQLGDHLNDIGGSIVQGFDDVGHGIRTAWNDVFGFVTGIPDWVAHLLQKLWHGVSDVAGDVWGDVTGAWDSVWGWIDSIPGKVAGGLSGMWDGIKDEFKTVITWLVGKWNDLATFLSYTIPSFVPGLGGDTITLLPHIQMPKFHSGGMVPGAPGSELPALLQAGETVRTGAQEAALQGALAVGGGGGGVTVENHFTFAGPIAGPETAKWVVAEVTRATKMNLPYKVNPTMVKAS